MNTPITETKPLLGKTILLIEDDQFILRIYTKWLTAAGAVVFTAHDGAQGLRTLAGKTIDLVLLDLGMPGLNGYETLAEIRKHDSSKDIPVVILSNTTMNENREGFAELKAAGVKDIMRKYEVSLTEIIQRISACFSSKNTEVSAVNN